MGHIVGGPYGEEEPLTRLFISGGTPTAVPYNRVCLLTSMSPVTECTAPWYSPKVINAPGGASPAWITTVSTFGVVASIDTAISWTGSTVVSIVGVGLKNSAGNFFAAAQLPQAVTMPATLTFIAGGLGFYFQQFSVNCKNAITKMYITGDTLSSNESHYFLAIPVSRTLRVALYSTYYDVNDTGTEITGTGYARQSVTFAAVGASPFTTVSNSSAVTFPVNSGGTNWSSIQYVVVTEASSWISGCVGGYAYKALSVPVTIQPGQQAVIPAGALTIKLD